MRWEHEAVIERMQQRLDRMPQAGRLRRQTVAHNLKRMMQIMGVQPLVAAMRAWRPLMLRRLFAL